MEPIISLDTTNHPNTLNEITISCEKLITETQCDIEIFRNEQQHFAQQVKSILEEKSRNDLITTYPVDSRDDATRERLTNELFQNVKKQLDYLQTENKDLRALNKTLQRTIENLEKEIQNYRNQLFQPNSVNEINKKYATTIKLLESSILNKTSDLKEKSDIIENLFEKKNHLQGHIEQLQKSIAEKNKEISKQPETSKTIAKLEVHLTETVRHNKELQKSLKASQQAIEERLKREESALQKVQEALTIAEAAVADKEEALNREKVVKEECDNIASTIGQVMDEAARKVEKDMETIKKKFVHKEKALNEEIKKLTEEIQNQKKMNQILDNRCKRYEEKYKDAMENNENLSHQLEYAAKALNDMEEKLNENESVKNNEVTLQKLSDQEKEIQHYLEANKQLHDKYRATLKDITNKFEKQIRSLQKEVDNLNAENQILKSNCGN